MVWAGAMVSFGYVRRTQTRGQKFRPYPKQDQERAVEDETSWGYTAVENALGLQDGTGLIEAEPDGLQCGHEATAFCTGTVVEYGPPADLTIVTQYVEVQHRNAEVLLFPH
jgi:hypothetical protein